MEIRQANLSDFEKYLIIKEKFTEEYLHKKANKEFILEEFTDYLKKGAIFIAVEENEIIGYIIGIIEENLYEKTGYIEEAFTNKNFRGQRVSTKIKDSFIKFLLKNNIHTCRIDVNPNNPAQETYKTWGFKIDKYRMSLNF